MTAIIRARAVPRDLRAFDVHADHFSEGLRAERASCSCDSRARPEIRDPGDDPNADETEITNEPRQVTSA